MRTRTLSTVDAFADIGYRKHVPDEPTEIFLPIPPHLDIRKACEEGYYVCERCAHILPATEAGYNNGCDRCGGQLRFEEPALMHRERGLALLGALL